MACQPNLTAEQLIDALKEDKRLRTLRTNHPATTDAFTASTETTNPNTTGLKDNITHRGHGGGRGFGRGRGRGRNQQQDRNGNQQRWCTFCETRTHNTVHCFRKSKSATPNTNLIPYQTSQKRPAEFDCYHCGEDGHVSYNCPIKAKAQARRNMCTGPSQLPANINIANSQNGGEGSPGFCLSLDAPVEKGHTSLYSAEVLFARNHSSRTIYNIRSIWIIDSGASHHFCNNRRMFTTFKTTVVIRIKLGDNHVCSNTGGQVTLNEIQFFAYYIPEFRVNLLSVSQFDTQGFKTTCKYGHCLIEKANQLLLVAEMKNGLYQVSTTTKRNNLGNLLITTRSMAKNLAVLLPQDILEEESPRNKLKNSKPKLQNTTSNDITQQTIKKQSRINRALAQTTCPPKSENVTVYTTYHQLGC